jgi:transcription antitermination factor NusG
MPILSAEPQFFPDDLFVRGAEGSRDRSWWLIHTKPRQEKSLSRHLHAASLPFYLPLVSKRLRVRNRTLTSYTPLFPGYVFLLAHGEERVAAFSTNRIVRAIPVVDQEKLWRDLNQVQRLIFTGAPITPEGRLTVGTVVDIRTGPLAGLRGKILKTVTGRRFVVEVDFIHRGASIVLDDFTLAPVIDSPTENG